MNLWMMSAPIRAHHATATEFDVTKLIVLQGKIRKIEWINPHAWLHLEVKDADGKVTLWKIEGPSPSALEIRRFPKEAIREDLEISMTAYPAKNGESMADGATITFRDGTRLFYGGSAPVDGLDKEGKPCIFGRNPECR